MSLSVTNIFCIEIRGFGLDYVVILMWLFYRVVLIIIKIITGRRI